MRAEKQQTNAMDTRNHVLNGLPARDLAALSPFAMAVSLASGDVLFEPDDAIERVYFPNTAVLSVVTIMEDGRAVESDTVGCESAVGLLETLAATRAISRTFTQIPGMAISIPAARIRQQAEANPALRAVLLRHTQANLAQAHQSVACNALHSVEQRLCRWLLASHDRTANDTIHITQQYLATMVGVQRTTVTQALHELVSARLIRQGRGQVQVLNRRGLEARACECHAALKWTLGRLVGQPSHSG
ncbi:MAG TPA: Crp/Fnr family transcriptional regulator [Caulobacteraceae bacterium]|nr:Crp/Fnr family transcriptional regulator [Caulobacteraceae bacterium]